MPAIGLGGMGFEGSAYMVDTSIVNVAGGTFAMDCVNGVETIDGLVETPDICGRIAGDGGAGRGKHHRARETKRERKPLGSGR